MAPFFAATDKLTLHSRPSDGSIFCTSGQTMVPAARWSIQPAWILRICDAPAANRRFQTRSNEGSSHKFQRAVFASRFEILRGTANRRRDAKQRLRSVQGAEKSPEAAPDTGGRNDQDIPDRAQTVCGTGTNGNWRTA